jgi:hypothetical protein
MQRVPAEARVSCDPVQLTRASLDELPVDDGVDGVHGVRPFVSWCRAVWCGVGRRLLIGTDEQRGRFSSGSTASLASNPLRVGLAELAADSDLAVRGQHAHHFGMRVHGCPFGTVVDGWMQDGDERSTRR